MFAENDHSDSVSHFISEIVLCIEQHLNFHENLSVPCCTDSEPMRTTQKNHVYCSKGYFFRVQGGCFWSPPSCRETELQRPPIYRHCSTAPSTNLFSVNSFVHSAWKNITWDLQFIPKMHQWRKYRKKLAPRRVCFTWKPDFISTVRSDESLSHSFRH